METPFHRQNADYLTGARGLNASSNAGGQYFLRSNLWNTDLPATIPAGVKKTGYFAEERLRGPILQGTTGHDLQLFWQDHPTEHFHAGAIPINTGSDYDITNVETERYAPAIIGRALEMSKHDYIAMAEQLMSSVDVHVSKSVRAFWDSGSIVSARGSGLRDGANVAHTPNERAEMVNTTDTAFTATSSSIGQYGQGLGKGQRILRTEDGTLHIFTLDRGTTSGSSNIPQWTHHAKPLNNDLFWNRKAMKVNPSSSAYDGKDECKPRLVDLGGATPTGWRVMGSAYASDSTGTIHAVIQYMTATGASRLYYTYAKRTMASYQPFPVYEWDWSAHTPVRIEAESIAGDGWDLREPTLVCDSLDRLHLACRIISGASTPASQIRHSHIIYATKLATEVNFPYLESGGTGDYADVLTGDKDWTIVNYYTNNPVAASDNQLSSTSGHASQDNDKPKICLLGDDTPVVFYRGMSTDYGTNRDCDAAYGARGITAVYVNVGAGASTTTPAGRFVFTSNKATMALGKLSGTLSGLVRGVHGVKYYDAVIDSDNKAYVIGVTDEPTSEVSLNSFIASESLVAQYSTTDGLGKTQILFKQRDADVTYTYSHLTATISDKDQLHMILNFTLRDAAGIGLGAVGETDTQEGTLAPLIWAGTPADPATLSYELPTTVQAWPTGGTNQSLTGPVKHFLEVWMPTHEVSQVGGSDEVIRSVNVRWLSVPSMGYDSTDGFYPVGSSQSLSGYEDFIHHAPQLRYQRYWGYNAGELDLRWLTNELSWIATPHGGSKLYYPYIGGSSLTVGEGETSGEGIAGWP